MALSSRNVRLSPEQRSAALVLAAALDGAEAQAKAGVQDAALIEAGMRRTIEAQPLAELDYAVVADPETLQGAEEIGAGAIALVAATFGRVRLIDNRLLRASV